MFTLWIKTEDLTDSRALYAEIEEFKVNLTDLIDYSLIYGDCSIEDALTVISLTEKYSHILSISLQKEQVQYLLIFLTAFAYLLYLILTLIWKSRPYLIADFTHKAIVFSRQINTTLIFFLSRGNLYI